MATIELQADLLDLLEALARAKAEFVLIGGWALAVHGHGRGTGSRRRRVARAQRRG
jgi:hypothetical protein